MALTLTTSGSLNTTVDNYAFSILSNTSSVQLGAVTLRFVIPGGCTIKNVNAGTSSVNNLTFLQQDGNLNIGMWTVSNWVVNTNDVILSITASGMSTGSFTLNTDEDWYCEIASSSAEPFTDFAIKMPSLASPYASVSTTLEAVSILSGVNPSITSVGAPNSSVFGSGSKTSGTASIAEGIGTLASGLASHAAGINTTASGQAAFSMGIETDADGMASFAAGSGSWAKGTATVAMGIGTIASSSGQLVVGHYNEAKTDINNIFVVGDGTSNSLRRNVIEVYGGQGALFRGVKIDTAATPTITTAIDGFNVYGKTKFFGDVTGSSMLANNFNANGLDATIQLLGTSTGSFTSNFYRRQNVLGGGPGDFEDVLKASVRLDHKGINFSLSEQTTAPGSTFLWTNSSNRLFYSSSAVILNDGNTLGTTMTIGTTDVNNLQLETNNTTRVFISSSGNVGIGKSNPTARLDISGSVITTGSLNVTGSLSLKGPLYDNLETAGTPDQILFTTSTGVEWRDNIANSAQDLVITGKNVGLTTIPKGTPLYFTGSGTSGNIVGILPADAGNPDRMPAGGVAGEQITTGSEGDVYIYGFISGVNTSAFSSGDDVFVAVGGGYTNIKPTGSAFIQKLGNVEKVDSSNGSGVIQGPSWYNDLPNWEIGRVMVGRSTGQPVTSSLVYLDEANGRLGLGTTTPTNTLQVNGGITATSITASIISASIGITGSLNVLNGNIKIDNSYKILGDSNHLTTYNYNSNFPSSTSASFGLVNIGGVGSYITAREDNLFGSSTILQFFTMGVERARITAGGRLGINTTTPGANLVVKGDSALSSGVTFQALNSSDATLLYVRDDGNVGIGTSSPTARLHISGANNGALLIASSSTAPSALFVSGSGNVGIGTATPTQRLDVRGNTIIAGTTPLNPVGGTLEVYNNASNAVLVIHEDSGSAEGRLWFRTEGSDTIFRNLNTRFSIDAETKSDALTLSLGGRVGIGISTSVPSSLLQVRGEGATSATTALRVENSNASASLVALDNGNVGIGTTTPSASLHVQGNFQISTGSLYTYGQNTDIDSGSIRTVMSVSTGSYRAAFFDYVLNKSTNARAGTVFSVWNGTSVEWNDVSTNDIGNTAEVNLSVGLSGANVLLYASSSTNDWSMKALARML